jgi:hypothetical protein
MEASTEYTAANNGSSQSPWEAHQAADSVGRPELPVIGAFVAGFVFAKLLKRFGGGDDD